MIKFEKKGIKEKCKKILFLMLVVVMMFASIPVTSYASGEVIYLEITRERAPLRKKSNDKGEIVKRYTENSIIQSTGSLINSKKNRWYKIPYEGNNYYIYSGNVKEHKHSYKQLVYDDVTYKYCNCGNVKVVTKEKEKLKASKAIATYTSTVGMAVAADGALPVGDVIGLGIIVFTMYQAATGNILDKAAYTEIIKEIDFGDYLKNREQVCTDESFRKVMRKEGKLNYIDDKCMDKDEAFFYVFYGGDVYTKYEETAEKLGLMYGNCFNERDKDAPSYFYHIHLGKDHKDKVGGHIFYGLNDYKEGPS